MKTQVFAEYDVAVCGGGFAGISAALAAAREGKRVVLLEKLYMLGGLGTAGLITIYLPLCDGYGRQVSFGIAEELLKLSIVYGDEGKRPYNWIDGVGTRTEKDPRYEVQFNPQLFAILAEKKLLEAGVDILYGTYVVGVKTRRSKITRLAVEGKSGRREISVGAVVDATGDCDIAHFARVKTETFRQGNLLAAWYYLTDEGGYRLRMMGAADVPEVERTDKNTPQFLTPRRFGGLEDGEISEMVCLSHGAVLEDWLKRHAQDPKVAISTIPTMPQLRMTRRIVGEYTLSYTQEHIAFEDSIGMVSNWKRRGPVYEVPFRTLYSAKVRNLITAGRCTSVDETLWDVMRVIPCCAVTGQAAGTAAAMTGDFTTLDISALQEKLKAAGVILHEADLEKEIQANG